jgi:hypothetical protein
LSSRQRETKMAITKSEFGPEEGLNPSISCNLSGPEPVDEIHLTQAGLDPTSFSAKKLDNEVRVG